MSFYRKKREKSREKNPFVLRDGNIRPAKTVAVNRAGWSEDVYISNIGHSEKIGTSFNYAKLPVVGAAFLLLLLVLAGRTAWLQIAKGEYYYWLAEGNRIRIERIEPKRGIIYDRNAIILARNQANFLLYFLPADLPKDEAEVTAITEKISGIMGDMSGSEIRERLSAATPDSLDFYQPLFIADNIEYEKAMRLYLESLSLPGVVLTNKIRREYPNTLTGGFSSGDRAGADDGYAGAGTNRETNEEALTFFSLSHILGYTGKINEQEMEKFGEEYLPIDYIGKMGIEYFWENELKGQSGRKQVEVDALGKEKKIIGLVDAQDGHNLALSLDLFAQMKLEEIIRAHLDRLKLNRAAAIVIDPGNGEILAMVSEPAYNNNNFARGLAPEEYSRLVNHPEAPLFNRSISGEYPSGSTIKPVIAAAALEDGIVSEWTKVRSVGGIRIGQWFFPDWLAGGHGMVDVRRALAESVNTFFYYVGGGYEDFRGLGLERIIRYGELFGLGAQTGIDLAGERAGLLPDSRWKEEAKGEKWYIGDTYHLSIGQGDILVTPLQVAVYTGAFANGGKIYRPHFVKDVLSADNEPISPVRIEPVRENFIDDYNIYVVREGMRQAVTAGSARRLSSLPVTAAGKTGTAQWSTSKKPHAWFTGFAPYDDPELVITILVEEGGEGSEVATPIAEEFFRWYFGEYKLTINN